MMGKKYGNTIHMPTYEELKKLGFYRSPNWVRPAIVGEVFNWKYVYTKLIDIEQKHGIKLVIRTPGKKRTWCDMEYLHAAKEAVDAAYNKVQEAYYRFDKPSQLIKWWMKYNPDIDIDVGKNVVYRLAWQSYPDNKVSLSRYLWDLYLTILEHEDELPQPEQQDSDCRPA
jgi:hypothetical protein